MSTRSPEIITRASEVDEDLVPEPWDPRDADSDRSLVAERERYRLQGVTGEDGAGIVPAYNLNVADTGSVPQKTQDGWTRGSAGRVLNAQGQYVSKGSDVPRKSFDGDEPGLLVEAASRTNQVIYSSDPTQWRIFGSGGVTFNSSSSIIGGETAHEVVSGGNGNDRIETNAGTFSGSTEVFYAILESGTSSKTRLTVRDTTNRVVTAEVTYNWSEDSLSSGRGTVDDSNVRTLQQNGPNGGKLVQIQFRYSNIAAGDERQFRLFIDRSGSGGGVYFHHAQIEEAPNASSPIVTQGSPVTRSGDDYAIFEGGQPSWWNPNEGTFFVDFVYPVYNFGSFISVLRFEDSNGFIGHLAGFSSANVSINDTNSGGAFNFGGTPYVRNKVAFSMQSGKEVASVNGSSEVGNSTPKKLDATNLFFNNGQIEVNSLNYFPRALPESTLNRITA